MLWKSLRHVDQTRIFVDTVSALWTDDMLAEAQRHPAVADPSLYATLHRQSGELVARLMRRFAINAANRIKPGIAEATRALLRRVPEYVLVSRREDPDVRLLLGLAARHGIPVEEAGDAILPYKAVTIIRKVR